MTDRRLPAHYRDSERKSYAKGFDRTPRGERPVINIYPKRRSNVPRNIVLGVAAAAGLFYAGTMIANRLTKPMASYSSVATEDGRRQNVEEMNRDIYTMLGAGEFVDINMDGKNESYSEVSALLPPNNHASYVSRRATNGHRNLFGREVRPLAKGVFTTFVVKYVFDGRKYVEESAFLDDAGKAEAASHLTTAAHRPEYRTAGALRLAGRPVWCSRNATDAFRYGRRQNSGLPPRHARKPANPSTGPSPVGQ